MLPQWQQQWLWQMVQMGRVEPLPRTKKNYRYKDLFGQDPTKAALGAAKTVTKF